MIGVGVEVLGASPDAGTAAKSQAIDGKGVDDKADSGKSDKADNSNTGTEGQAIQVLGANSVEEVASVKLDRDELTLPEISQCWFCLKPDALLEESYESDSVQIYKVEVLQVHNDYATFNVKLTDPTDSTAEEGGVSRARLYALVPTTPVAPKFVEGAEASQAVRRRLPMLLFQVPAISTPHLG